MEKPIYPHTVIEGDFDWMKINSLPDDCWFFDEQDALTQAEAEICGESFVCGDGKVKLTPCKINFGTRVEEPGYLVEFLE